MSSGQQPLLHRQKWPCGKLTPRSAAKRRKSAPTRAGAPSFRRSCPCSSLSSRVCQPCSANLATMSRASTRSSSWSTSTVASLPFSFPRSSATVAGNVYFRPWIERRASQGKAKPRSSTRLHEDRVHPKHGGMKTMGALAAMRSMRGIIAPLMTPRIPMIPRPPMAGTAMPHTKPLTRRPCLRHDRRSGRGARRRRGRSRGRGRNRARRQIAPG